MAKNKKMPANEKADAVKSEEVLTVVDKKTLKKQRAEEKAKQPKTAQKQSKKKKNDKPKRNFAKETMSELKKVSWPSFKQALAQTGTVLVVVAVFMFVVLGIDLLLNWIINLIVNI